MEHSFYAGRLPWHYNQAIGWIRLKGHWDVIKADYHFAREKRIVRQPRHRVFDWQGKTLEVWFHSETSQEIYQLLIDDLEALRDEWPFKGRYIDLQAFKNIGPHVDWKNAVV